MAGLSDLERDEALVAVHTALSQILPEILKYAGGRKGDPGQGLGYWTRDYAHAIFLAHDPELDPRFILSCVFGGTLHDIGTMFVDRYAGKERAVCHAKSAAFHLAMSQYIEQTEFLLSFMNELPDRWHRLPGVNEDVRSVIRPYERWFRLL